MLAAADAKHNRRDGRADGLHAVIGSRARAVRGRGVELSLARYAGMDFPAEVSIHIWLLWSFMCVFLTTHRSRVTYIPHPSFLVSTMQNKSTNAQSCDPAVIVKSTAIAIPSLAGRGLLDTKAKTTWALAVWSDGPLSSMYAALSRSFHHSPAGSK